jgi:hypothetical protein
MPIESWPIKSWAIKKLGAASHHGTKADCLRAGGNLLEIASLATALVSMKSCQADAATATLRQRRKEL